MRKHRPTIQPITIGRRKHANVGTLTNLPPHAHHKRPQVEDAQSPDSVIKPRRDKFRGNRGAKMSRRCPHSQTWAADLITRSYHLLHSSRRASPFQARFDGGYQVENYAKKLWRFPSHVNNVHCTVPVLMKLERVGSYGVQLSLAS